MKVTITVECDNAAFDGSNLRHELKRILMSVVPKVVRQRRRDKGCICTAPEVDDKLLDINGNTVGSIVVEN